MHIAANMGIIADQSSTEQLHPRPPSHPNPKCCPMLDKLKDKIRGYESNNVIKSSEGGAYRLEIPDEEDVMLSDCKGTKKAVFIGINYFGTDLELDGCINDVKNIREFVQTQYGFPPSNCITLTDDQTDPLHAPTRKNIMNAIEWLVTGAKAGDSLFFHYSGHGEQVPDLDGDEADGLDETILPVDHLTAGQIIDDELNIKLVKPLPQGVRLTVVTDACHSGSVLDLPYLYQLDGSIKLIDDFAHHKEAARMLMKAGNTFLENRKKAMGMLKQGIAKWKQGHREKHSQKRAMATKSSSADVVHFSACKDDQTAADAMVSTEASGAMSHALVEFLSQNHSPTYLELLFGVRENLRGKFLQVPQMSTGRVMDMSQKFFM